MKPEIFLNSDSLHAWLSSHFKTWSYKKKMKKKKKSIKESSLERNQRQKCLSTLDLKPFRSYVIGKHSKCRTIPESSCARKDTSDINTFITSRNADKKSCYLLG